MKTPSLRNPYTPAAGVVPPCLAGGSAPQSWLLDEIRELGEGRVARSEVLVYAPRGHGKTALLAEDNLGREARRHGVSYMGVGGRTLQRDLLDVLEEHTPLVVQEQRVETGMDVFKTFQHRGERSLGKPTPLAGLAGQVGMRRLLKALLDVAHLLPAPRAGSGAAAEGKVPVRVPGSLILVVDEAHETTPRDLGELLTASQHIRIWDKRPLLVVLAGTPGLKATLRRAEKEEANRTAATFWDKTKRFPLDLLSRDATCEAFTAPLQEQGIQVEADALERMVIESRSYPTFIQMLGRAVWDALEEGSVCIDAKVLETALPPFRARYLTLYKERMDEILDAGLVAPAIYLGQRMKSVEAAGRYPDRLQMLGIIEQALIETLGSDARAWRELAEGPALHGHASKEAEVKDLLGLAKTGQPLAFRDLARTARIPVLDYLTAKGFVWEPEAGPYRLGIRSLASYLLEAEAAASAAAGPKRSKSGIKEEPGEAGAIPADPEPGLG